jgi:sensor c-di-GMP phosphodiesterase-like protein
VKQPGSNLSFTVVISAVLASTIIAVLLGTSFSYSYLKSSFAPEAEHIVNLTVGDIDLRSERLAAVSKYIEKIDNVGCNAASLSLMRRYIANSIGIFDIGILDASNRGANGLNCSAMSGVIGTEFFRASPVVTLENGAKLWNSYDPGVIVAHPMATGVNNRSAYAYSYNQFIYFIEPLPIQTQPPRIGEWEMVYNSPTPIHLSGTEGLYKEFESGNLDARGVVTVACSEQDRYCAMIFSSWLEIVKKEPLTIVVLLISAFLVAIGLFVLFIRFIQSGRSTKTRSMKALQKKLFYCHYQPIVSVADGLTVGCEALARLNDKFGPISPVDFIPVFESQKHMQKFTEAIFEQAYIGLHELKWDGQKPFKLSVNIFPQNLNAQTICFFEGHRARKDKRIRICLEVTEDSRVHDDQFRRVVAELNQLGIEVSVDDFGTGYGNLSRIASPGLKYLKIDRSLVSSLTVTNAKNSLCWFIPPLAQKVGLDVIAEGVENIDNLEAIRLMGVKYAQGYYFGRPQAAEELIKLVSSQRKPPLNSLLKLVSTGGVRR